MVRNWGRIQRANDITHGQLADAASGRRTSLPEQEEEKNKNEMSSDIGPVPDP